MVITCAAWRAMGAGRMAMLARVDDFLSRSAQQGAQLALLPGLCISEMGEVLLTRVQEWTRRHPGIAVCPGSAYLEHQGKGYHAASIYMGGEEVLCQCQLYLSKWEKKVGLSRGSQIETLQIGDMRTAVILSTDVFYPQVAEEARALGVQLMINPATYTRTGTAWELAGMWRMAQQVNAFAAESPCCGHFYGQNFVGEAHVYAPLAATEDGSGYLVSAVPEKEMITAHLSAESLAAAQPQLHSRKAVLRELYGMQRGENEWG